MTGALIDVAGRLVNAYEFELLELLAGRASTVQQLRAERRSVRPRGWDTLRALTSLEARGLVHHTLSSTGGGHEALWRLSGDARRVVGK